MQLCRKKQRGRTPYASFFSIHLWIPRVLIVPRGKDHHNGTQTRPFVSLSKRMPRSGERGQQLSPSSRLPRCFAVPPGGGKKRPSMLPCGRRTDARLGHGVVMIHSGSYWIINTLDFLICSPIKINIILNGRTLFRDVDCCL